MFIIDFKPFTIEKTEYIDSFFHVHHYEGIDCSFNTLFYGRKRTIRSGR